MPRKFRAKRTPRLKRSVEGGANSAHFAVGAVAGAAAGRAVGRKLGGRKVNVNLTSSEKVRVLKAAVKNSPMKSLKAEVLSNKTGARTATYIANNRAAEAAASYRGTRFTDGENKNARKLYEASERTRSAAKFHAEEAMRKQAELGVAKKNVRQVAKNNMNAIETGRKRLRSEKARVAGRRGTAVGMLAGLAAGWLTGELTKKKR